MDLTLLRTFVEVTKRRSFAAVARDRGVTPSAISRAVAALETELGVRLFQRNTRHLAPTEAGELFFDRIEPLLEELTRAQVVARDASATARGTLRITAPVTFGQMALVPLLPEFGRTYPDLAVDLRLEDGITDLLAERIDVALRLGRLPNSGFVATRLCSMPFLVCASPEYLSRAGCPKTPREIENHPCLLLPLPGYDSQWHFCGPDGETVGVSVSGRCTISNALALLQCALAGMGIVLLPAWAAAAKIREGSLTPLFPEFQITPTDFDSAAWLLYPSRTYLPLKVRVFVNFMKARFAVPLPWDDVTLQNASNLLPTRFREPALLPSNARATG